MWFDQVSNPHKAILSMPITIESREDNHAIYTKISDPVALKDFDNATVEMTPLYDNAPGKVHQLVNTSAMRQVPSGLLRIRGNTPIFQHPNRGHLALVGTNSFLRAVGEIMFKLVQFETAKFFNNDDEAWAYLREVIAKEKKS